DLLFGEGPYFLAVDDDDADQLVLFEHWDGQEGPRAKKLDRRHTQWVALGIGRLGHKVGDVNDLLRSCSTAKTGVRTGTDRRTLAFRNKRGWGVVEGNEPERIALVQQ